MFRRVHHPPNQPTQNVVLGSHGTAPNEPLICSFCNKHQNEVRRLIAGPTVFICDECVEVCNDILADDAGMSAGDPPEDGPVEQPSEAWPARGVGTSCSLCRMVVPAEEALVVEKRGMLCAGCADAVEAALAARRAPPT